MPSYTFIDSNRDLEAYLGRLRDRRPSRGVQTIAIDIEAEFNLHVYGERFCLLQIADGEEEVLVDPDAVSRDSLARILEDRSILKIMYDCSSDRMLLYKTHQILLCSILDLRPAVELLGFDRQDLSSVLEAALGVSKGSGDVAKKRFQQYNWTRRPYDAAALEYAVDDVRYLHSLKDTLMARLSDQRLMDAFVLENIKRQDTVPDTQRRPGVFRSGRFRKLGSAGRARFEQLYEIRERHAERLDLPPNSVVANGDLFDLAAGSIGVQDIRGNRRISPQDLELVKRDLGRTGRNQDSR